MGVDKWKKLVLTLLFIIASFFPIFPIIFADTPPSGSTAITHVTVTNEKPYILSASMNLFISVGDASLTLTENSTVAIICNATVNDPNGFGDISASEASPT